MCLHTRPCQTQLQKYLPGQAEKDMHSHVGHTSHRQLQQFAERVEKYLLPCTHPWHRSLQIITKEQNSTRHASTADSVTLRTKVAMSYIRTKYFVFQFPHISKKLDNQIHLTQLFLLGHDKFLTYWLSTVFFKHSLKKTKQNKNQHRQL